MYSCIIVTMWEVIDSISRYVLLHHTMGGYDGGKTWCYVEGGMGSVSMAIAKAAQLHGAELHTEKVNCSFGESPPHPLQLPSTLLFFTFPLLPFPPSFSSISSFILLHLLPPSSSSSPHVPCSPCNRSL